MEEITGPVLAITLVLCAVFVPCCFLGGITGQFFRQFAVTIAVSTIISAVNALTMTPSRAVLIFKTEEGSRRPRAQARGVALVDLRRGGRNADRLAGPGLPGRPVRPRLLGRGTAERRLRAGCPGRSIAAYFVPGAVVGGRDRLVHHPARERRARLVLPRLQPPLRPADRGLRPDRSAGVLRVSAIVLLVYGGLLVLTYWQFNRTPTGFIPQQDKGYLLLNVQLPDSASVERTQRVMARIEALARETPGVEHTVGVSGQSLILNANAPNLGSMYVMLKEFAAAARPRADGRRDRRGAARPLPARGARGDRLGVRGAADRRPGHDRRLQADHRGSRQSRPGRAAAGQRSDRRPGQRDAGPAGPVQQLPGQHALAVPRDRPDQVHGPGRAGQRASSTRCRSTWARTTSTTSTSSAGPGR